MQNQHRSPASMQDVAREADVPAPKNAISTRVRLIAVGLIAVSMTGLIALIFLPARATTVQKVVPAQNAAATQWQAPGPGETVKAAEATTPTRAADATERSAARTGQAIQQAARTR